MYRRDTDKFRGLVERRVREVLIFGNGGDVAGMAEGFDLRNQPYAALPAVLGELTSLGSGERMIVGDELGMRFEAKGGALVVGQAEQYCVQLPVLAEIDNATVIVGALGESGCVDHDAAKTVAASLSRTRGSSKRDRGGHAAKFQEVASAHGEIMAGQRGFPTTRLH